MHPPTRFAASLFIPEGPHIKCKVKGLRRQESGRSALEPIRDDGLAIMIDDQSRQPSSPARSQTRLGSAAILSHLFWPKAPIPRCRWNRPDRCRLGDGVVAKPAGVLPVQIVLIVPP